MVEIFDNIRKIYQFQAACEELASHIEFFSESSADKSLLHVGQQPFSVRMFPSWTPTIWINLGESYQLTLGMEKHWIGAGEDILVLRDGLTERHNHPSDHIFTVKFQPGGLDAILDLRQAAMTGRPIPLEKIIPSRLIHQVKQAATFEERVSLLEDYFLWHGQRKKKRDHYLRMVGDIIHTNEALPTSYNSNEMAERMCTTSRTISRYFNNVIGTSPKSYFSLVRARASLTAYVADKETFSPDDFGYYDMSHFYKGVQAFTGQKLSDFYPPISGGRR